MFKSFRVYYLKPLVFLLGALSFLFGDAKSSDSTFLFCLKSHIVPLQISKNENSFSIKNNNQLERFLIQNHVIDIEEWIPHANENDHDGDIYLNRIYRAYIDTRMQNISSVILEIENLSIVKYAEKEFIRTPKYSTNDPLFQSQCSLSSVKAQKAWDFWDIPNGVVPQSREVLLASVDTGVDYTHPDIQNNSWINQAEIPEWMAEAGLDSDGDGYIEASEVVGFLVSENMDVNSDGEINLRDMVSSGSPFEDGLDNDGNGYADDLLGWDSSGSFGTDDNDPFPKEGVANNSGWAHGTHVAGILAATSDNDLGMASTSYNAKYISVKVSRDNQSGEPGINDGYAGILYAAKAGYYAGTYTIINNSWGGGGYSGSENATINTAHDTYGAVIISAAGNGLDDVYDEEYSSHYPSSYENSVGVCAMGCSGSWGGWATYHYTVDLAAPGESIHSAIIGSGYEAWDGSSMASPNAASCFGLLKSYYPDLSNVELRARIEDSADRVIYDINPEYETCNGNAGDDCFGKGMVDIYKAIGKDFSPNIMIESSYVQTINDDDGILNPGETAYLVVNLENEVGWTEATSLQGSLSVDNSNITIINANSFYDDLPSGQIGAPNNYFLFTVGEEIDLGELNFSVSISANGSNNYQYSNELTITNDVSLFQSGYPYDTNTELTSTPIVEDLDNDGLNEIVVGGKDGQVRILQDGVEIENNIFPFDTGDQIWGAIASADLDLDGYIDFVVTSKSKSLYIFDINGLKSQYDTQKYITATPVIGNFDQDDSLEVAFGTYSSPTSANALYVVNHDGTDVAGFPYVVGEKMKAGAAAADMNDDGTDDIVFGTDSDNLHVVLSSGISAPNFPVSFSDRIQSEPAILVLDNGDKIILSGCKDNNFYGVNYNDGSLRFLIPTGDDVFTSASYDDDKIYFGSDDGKIYAIDIDGNLIDGYPFDVGDEIVGSVIFSDLDNDGESDKIIGTSDGKLHVYDEQNNPFDYFPINYQFPIASSPLVSDIDGDEDLDILVGTSGDLIVVDFKEFGGVSEGFWSIFKGDNQRSGLIRDSDNQWEDCASPDSGDVNCDTIINILDVVTIVNMVIGGLENYSNYELWAADINQDSIVNVLDIVAILNLIIPS